jgi:NitT/TauT family transport system substrate-binding protein
LIVPLPVRLVLRLVSRPRRSRKEKATMDNALRRLTLCFVLIVGMLLCTCAPPSPPAAQPPPEPIALKVGTKPYLTYAPFFIADQEGFFAEQGLEIEYVKLDPQNTLPAVIQGEVDVTAGLLSAGLLNAMARGARLRVVAGKGYIDPGGCAFFALVARQSLVDTGQAGDPGHLKGRRVDVLPGSWHNFYLARLLATIGLTPADLELTNLPSASEGEAMDKGALDLAVSGEPWLTRMLRAGHSPVLAPIQELMPESQPSVVLFGPNLLDENPDAGRRFMVAYLQGVRQLNQGKTQRNREILGEQIGLDDAFLQQACWPAIRDDGSINLASVLEFQDWAVEAGLVEKPVAGDQIWDPRFVDQANQLLSSSTP